MKIKLAKTEKEIKQALAVRRDVFIKEQGVAPEIELDGKDEGAVHFLAKQNKEVIATCRLRTKEKQGKLERMAVKKEKRKQGIGSRLLKYVISYARENKLHKVTLNAQKRVTEFYKKHGFKVISQEIIKEAGIDHLQMELVL